jgi:amino acid transporter
MHSYVSSHCYSSLSLKGEFPAVLAAWCLSLEYGISGSAVARSWGDKVNAYIASFVASNMQASIPISGDFNQHLQPDPTFWNPFSPGYGINLFAGLLQIAVVIVLLAGIDIGKFAVNSFTIVKIVLVIFMIISGLMLFQKENFEAGWAPMGMSGILRGATSCFFGFVGYDEVHEVFRFYSTIYTTHYRLFYVMYSFLFLWRNLFSRILLCVVCAVCCDKQVCCLAAEAKDPNRVLPLAVFGTITIVTVFYCLASLALVGMQDYRNINVDSGFSEALKSRGCVWSQNFVALGKICLLCPRSLFVLHCFVLLFFVLFDAVPFCSVVHYCIHLPSPSSYSTLI